MEIIKSLIPPNNSNRPDAHQPEYITIHETGNPSKGADAAAHAKYLNSLKEKISWHYTVDDHGACQHLPDWEGGYHAGDGSGDTLFFHNIRLIQWVFRILCLFYL